MTRAMQFDVTARSNVAREFLEDAAAAERFEKKLKDLDRLKVEPSVDLNITPANRKVDQLKSRLDALRNVRAKVEVDGAAEARHDVTQLVVELRKIRDQRAKIQLDTGTAKADVTAIATAMRAVRDTSVQLDIRTGASEGRITTLHGKMTALRALSPLRLVVEVDDRASTQLNAIKALSDGLAAARPTVQVDADTAGASAQLAALLAQLAALGASATSVRVRLDTPTFLGQLARIQTELRTLAGGDIRITANTRQLMEELARARVRLAELQAMPHSVVVEADTLLARHQIEELERELARIAGRQYTARVDVDRGALDRVARAGALLAGLGAAGGIAAAGTGAATASVASLAGAVASLIGLAPLAVSGLMSVVSVAAAVKLGVVGLDEAFKNLDDPAKFAEALKELSPAGREFATTVRDLKPAFDGVRLDVQQRLLAGYGAETRTLADKLLPSLKAGVGGTATELNLAGKELVRFATSGSTVRDVDTIFKNTNATLAAGRPIVTNLAAALVDVGVVGSSVMPELAGGATQATARFREWIDEARKSGQLEQWIRGGIDTLQQLGRIAGNVGGSLGAIFTAADASGADFLATAERVTEEVERLLQSAEGQDALIAFFRESRATIDELLPGLQSAGQFALDFLSSFSDTGGLSSAAAAVTDLVQSVAPLGSEVGQLAGDTLRGLAAGGSALASGLSPAVSVVTALLDVLGPVPGIALAMLVAFKGFGVVGGMITALGVSVAGLAGRMGASEAATSRLAGVFRGLGLAVPIAAAALVGIAAVYDQLASKAEESAAKIANGSMTVAQAVEEELTRLRARSAAMQGMEGEGAAIGQAIGEMTGKIDANAQALAEEQEAVRLVEQGWNDYLATLTPFEQLQARVARAQSELNSAVAEFGMNSPQASSAASDLTRATAELEAAERGADAAAKAHNLTLEQRVEAVRTALGAMLDMEATLARVAEAEKAANDAAREHGAGSAEAAQANRNFAEAADQAAQAVGNQARAAAEAQGATNAAEIGARAYAAALVQTAAAAEGPARSAMFAYIDSLTDAELQALNAGVAASGFATRVETLPSGRTVMIAVDPETGKIIEVQQLVDGLQNKTVTINGETMPVENALTRVMALFAANPDAMININGQDMPARQVLSTLLGLVTSSSGTITVNGQAMPAQQVLDAIIAAINSGAGTVTLNGNQVPLADVLRAAIGSINTSTGTVKMNANDQAVVDAKRRAQQPTFSTHTIRTVVQQTSHIQQGGKGLAGGGLVGYAGGGVQRAHAARGLVVPGYSPGVDSVPALISRGEAVLVPELVKQLGAQRILAANAAASGGRPATVVGNIAGLMDGTIDRQHSNATTATSSSPAGGRTVVQLTRPEARGRAAAGGPGLQLVEVVQAVNALRADLRSLSNPPDAIAEPIVRAVARVERALAARAPDTASTAQARRVNAELGALG